VTAAPRHQFLKADIADTGAMTTAFRDFEPDAVLHLAAESHVDRSIDDPAAFIATNVQGTFVLLETALKYWSRRRARRHVKFCFVHASTDEVFGALTENGTFRANSRYAPNSPYAPSKAAADHLARAWHHTYHLPVIITNCSNNYGPRQHAEKLVPTVIRHALAGEPIPIYGAGHNIRDWLYVDDHVTGLMAVVQRGLPGDTYLFGGRSEVRNLDLAEMICRLLDARAPRPGGRCYAEQISFVPDRPGHDFRYAIDPSHAETVLGWKTAERLENGMAKTVDWYLAHRDWLVPGSALGRLGNRTAAAIRASS
jgi:dTDP-glucose 4,6-dehydratase